MTRAQIEAGILAYLAKQPGWVRAEARGSAGKGLIEHRVLDSLALLEFVSFIEKFCGIEVPSDDITEEHFDNVDDLFRYIETKQGIAEEAL
jgi:acyl carrier protein